MGWCVLRLIVCLDMGCYGVICNWIGFCCDLHVLIFKLFCLFALFVCVYVGL